MSTKQKLDAIRAERGKVYGDPKQSHENIGLGWTGLIQQHYGITLPHALPSWLVEQMMCSLKLQRACRVYHADNYDDLGDYSRFAEEEQAADERARIR